MENSGSQCAVCGPGEALLKLQEEKGPNYFHYNSLLYIVHYNVLPFIVDICIDGAEAVVGESAGRREAGIPTVPAATEFTNTSSQHETPKMSWARWPHL